MRNNGTWLALLPGLIVTNVATAWAQDTTVVDDNPSRQTQAARAKRGEPATDSEWKTVVAGEATYGIGVRTSAQKSNLKPGGGNNSDDGNLNYPKGSAFANVVQGEIGVDVRHRSGYGITLSGMAWYDYNLIHHWVPHGNNPNNYVPGPLSDQGFLRQARFTGIDLLDTYVYGKIEPGLGTLDWRVGKVTLPREPGFTFVGGLRDLEARNTAASTRPGAQPNEAVIPFWGATARWAVTPLLRVEGFWQFAPERSESAGCGTFFASNDYTPQGCNRVFYNKAITEQQAAVAGVFIPRVDDITPKDRPEQVGLGVSYLIKPLGTRAGVYAAHYDSRVGYVSTLKGTGLGPNGGNSYLIDYPANKNLLSFTTATRIPSLNIGWLNEVTIINGQPLQQNPSLLLAAFLRGEGPYAPGAIAQPPRTVYQGYDRFRVIQVQTGARKEFGAGLGASSSFLAFEVGLKHVFGLPDRATRPYGRPEIDDACNTDAECDTLDGFVTSNAWAYRIHGGMTFGPIRGTAITLRPTFTFGHDVSGWAFDYAFVQDRKSIRLGLDADFTRYVFANISFAATRGGLFNTRKDRDFVVASVGIRFAPRDLGKNK
jgi:hypothetical protein